MIGTLSAEHVRGSGDLRLPSIGETRLSSRPEVTISLNPDLRPLAQKRESGSIYRHLQRGHLLLLNGTLSNSYLEIGDRPALPLRLGSEYNLQEGIIFASVVSPSDIKNLSPYLFLSAHVGSWEELSLLGGAVTM